MGSFDNNMINNKVCVVVGSADVMCATAAREMAKNGYVTAIVDKDIDAAKRIADEICTFGGFAKAFCGCASDITSMKVAQEQISLEFGKCNVIVNIIGDSHESANVNNMLISVQTFLNEMSDMQGCSIINICHTDININGELESKLIEYTEKIAMGLAKFGIRANAIIYGPMISRSNKNDYLNDENTPTSEAAEKMLLEIPMHRFGKPEEIVGALKYLADPMASSYTTGAVIRVDGGYSLSRIQSDNNGNM